ncbi:RidA family protein [Selenomonas sp. TAMA-11512]|uniref:RidA family protein n=1 Tax=Selenomonas sp. TAMA-11512 TaxID=3095337 RepID=UPI003092CB9F|nr:RidA family protein [Selenomonas sp. TAMA-11512]
MKKIITTDKAPAALGPYSQGIRTSGGFIFASGQIAIDPATGELVAGGIKEQTTQVMENLAAVLAAEESTFDDVVKTTIYLKDINDFVAVNTVYAKYFSENPPARVCVQVAALPKDALIEIELIAEEGHAYSY